MQFRRDDRGVEVKPKVLTNKDVFIIEEITTRISNKRGNMDVPTGLAFKVAKISAIRSGRTKKIKSEIET
jgi:hypothetical protein